MQYDRTAFRHYEVVFMVHPDQSEQVPGMLERYRANIEAKSGKIHRLEDWGRKQLAYPINKLHKAHYILMNIECDSESLKELENAFRFNDAVIRHLILVQDEAVTEPSAILKERDDRKEGYTRRGDRGRFESEAFDSLDMEKDGSTSSDD